MIKNNANNSKNDAQVIPNAATQTLLGVIGSESYKPKDTYYPHVTDATSRKAP